jgi:hypothetical protein
MMLSIACSHGSEQVILDEFFDASRLRDRTALQVFATVAFEPHIQGIVTRFAIARVGPEEHKPLSTLPSEIGIAALSVDDPRRPIDVRQSSCEMISKGLTVIAPVRLPNGQVARKMMNIILQRAILKGERQVVGRWIVTGIVVHGADS